VAVKEINDSNFESEIKKGLVMVDFWAPWCAPCRMVAPVLDELSLEFKDQITIAKLNVDENIQAASKYSVTSIPTLIIFKNGELVERTVGAGPKQHYLTMLNKHLTD
jgi:thioredoxin 1